jgi:hypothetical protein
MVRARDAVARVVAALAAAIATGLGGHMGLSRADERAGNEPAAAEKLSPVDDLAAKAARLIAAYPDHLDRVEGKMLVWKQGGDPMVFDDGHPPKEFDALMTNPDIKDQFHDDYPLGPVTEDPKENFDPGRFRNEAFFERMYGDCVKGEVTKRLVPVAWLPKHGGGKLSVTSVNEVNKKLEKVSDELDKLLETHKDYKEFLIPSAGVYNCRNIAGSNLKSVHAYGAAIDISTAHSDYWRWPKKDAKSRGPVWSRIPYEIVEIFERNGFIWGGKWYHFDTMHFEYRPELLPKR